jgi:Tol biopolymer transport system component
MWSDRGEYMNAATHLVTTGIMALVAATASAGPASATAGTPLAERMNEQWLYEVSRSGISVQAEGESLAPSLSSDGRYVSFLSQAENLVPGDANNQYDIFVRDRQASTFELISLSSGGSQANDFSEGSAISGDGRYVAFQSMATNLVPGDTNDNGDVFVRDRQTNTTERVNVSGAGAQAGGLTTIADISADGRYVTFTSSAANLVAGDTNGAADVFVRDRLWNTTDRVSVSGAGAQGGGASSGGSISADGRYVTFTSSAANLVAGDTNGAADVFVRDRLWNTTDRVSVSGAGAQGGGESSGGSISADGRYVAFLSSASNLVPGDTNYTTDIFVHDRYLETTELASVDDAGGQADAGSFNPLIGENGRYVAFVSGASNLISEDYNEYVDVFVRDRSTQTTIRVSESDSSMEPNNESYSATMSADGRYVGFMSWATNLMAGDNNNFPDIFVTNRHS